MSYPTYPNTYSHTFSFGGKEVTVEIGKFSQQVSAAVLVTMGETVVHSTVALGRKVNLGYFPLSVDLVEKLYSSGTIKGSRWVKRDGRPTDAEVLKARLIDRSLRPLFPDGITHEVQVINTVLSYDGQNDPDMLGLLGSSLALSISDIPFDGPLSGLRVGYFSDSGEYVFNPTHEERDKSDLDMIVSGSDKSIVMVEAGANEVSEAVVVEAMVRAQEVLGELCAGYATVMKEVAKEKQVLITDEDITAAKEIAALGEKLLAQFASEIREVVLKQAQLEESGQSELAEKMLAWVNTDAAEDAQVTDKQVKAALYDLTKADARKMILEENIRPDGRKMDEIRQIWTEVDLFPRTHGSAMFKRGATQGVTITTLGSPSLAQYVEGISGMEVRHYMHFYNMPPYASGEAGRFGYPKRREIGHGALAERALEPMIPSQEEFPYAIHVVTEIMSSNGSTSQAAVCGSSMSLMAAGVPIKRAVAGIAMGLMSDGKKFVVLSDIQGLEDHVGDMDFKVAGTSEGITAIQMDIKLKGIPRPVLEEALEQAKVSRLHIMGEMNKCISEPRKMLSTYAPKIEQVAIPQDKIGELIGPGGKNIKALSEMFEVEISVEEHKTEPVGIVVIAGVDLAKLKQAKQRITDMFRKISIDDEFDGTVTRVESYGFFVEFLPGREGLVHVSNAAVGFVRDAADIASEGDTVHVRVNEIKDDGKISLSMLSKEEEAQSREEAGKRRDSDGGSRSGGDRGGDRGGRGGGGYGGGQRPRFGGSKSRDRHDRR